MEIQHWVVIVIVVVFAAVAIATVRSNISSGSLAIKTDNRYRKNNAVVRGESNRVRQGKSHSDEISSENKSDVDGKNNDLTQE
ncbi:hypothetical protein LZG74_20040 [Dyadobacter sp. CY327]|uniref:hypothetical protein n=1 Tax=Dyadobacter sp. CY327 TaxID=2907301 RepID=UPI001F444B28|nr:hypothetical protein [Dyadobacter sp. CY327]MCE7072615.1 hypothetical protein [Dyadobacter sp. CY327]